jgi:hypothetical protein
MRALGDFLVILGLTVATFTLRPGDTLDDAGARQVDEIYHTRDSASPEG